VLVSTFPDFPYRDNATEVSFHTDQTINRHNQRLVKQAMMASAQALQAGDPYTSLAVMRNVTLTTAALPAVDAVRSFLVADELDRETETGVLFPWITLHRLTGGMHPGDFVVYSARSTVGKSWSLVYTACEAAMAGMHVRYLSLEMPARQLVERIHTVLGNQLGYRISHTGLHQKSVDKKLYKKLLADLQDKVPGRIDVVDSTSGRITPNNLGGGGVRPDLVIVDYLQLMGNSDGRRAVDDWRAMASISNQCKEQAIALGLPVLAAAQLNRDGARSRAMPTIAELAQSDSIGQDADVVIMQRRMGTGPVMRYHIAKNRHGLSEADFFSRFEPDYGKFTEINRTLAEELADEDEEWQG
jgi:replicative DNA helicase